METTFRIAEISDTEILMKFIQEFYKFDNHPFNNCTIRTRLAKILNNDGLGRVWLIQHSSEAICYIILTFGYSLEYQAMRLSENLGLKPRPSRTALLS